MTNAPQADLTDRVRKFALEELDVDLFGVAPVERLAGAPEGSRPTDYLSSATSVIVLAMRIPRGALQVAGHYEEPGKTLSPYMWYGYVALNQALSQAAGRVSRYLEKNGYTAVPFPPTGVLYKFGSRADFSHRHAAVAAGLGELGYSGLVLTPEFGAGQRLVSIITDAPLVPSPMYEGPALCRPEVCKRACVRVCPTDALQRRAVVSIGDRVFQHAPVHPVRCKWRCAEKGYFRTKVPMPADPTEEDHEEVLRTARLHPFDVALNQHGFVPQCGACIFRCPSPRFENVEA